MEMAGVGEQVEVGGGLGAREALERVGGSLGEGAGGLEVGSRVGLALRIGALALVAYAAYRLGLKTMLRGKVGAVREGG
jgi:hypothetical protein